MRLLLASLLLLTTSFAICSQSGKEQQMFDFTLSQKSKKQKNTLIITTKLKSNKTKETIFSDATFALETKENKLRASLLLMGSGAHLAKEHRAYLDAIHKKSCIKYLERNVDDIPDMNKNDTDFHFNVSDFPEQQHLAPKMYTDPFVAPKKSCTIL